MTDYLKLEHTKGDGRIENVRAMSELYDYDSLTPKELVKTDLNWFNLTSDLPTYSPTGNNLIQMYLPRDLIYVPHESYFTLTVQMTPANAVTNDEYTALSRLENVYALFQSVLIQVGEEPSFQIPLGYSTWKAIEYSYTSDDFIKTVLKDTGYQATIPERNYFSGNEITNTDATSSGGQLLPGNLAGDDTGHYSEAWDATNLADNNVATIRAALNNAYTSYLGGVSAGAQGVNQTLGLSLAPVAAGTGIVVPNGYTYRMKIDGLFDQLKAVPLHAMPRVKLSLLLNNPGACIASTSATPSFTISNFVYHMRKAEVPAKLYEEIKLKQIRADADLALGSVFEYQNIWHNTFQLPVSWSGQQSFQFNVNLEQCKAIFCVFRQSSLTNVSVSGGNPNDNQNSNFIIPFVADNAGVNTFQYQFVIDSNYYPLQYVSVSSNNCVEASTMMMEAMGTLNDIGLGDRFSSASYLNPGNFIVGLRLNSNHDTKSGKSIGTLNLNLINSTAGPAYAILGDMFVVYESTLVTSNSSARLISSRPF